MHTVAIQPGFEQKQSFKLYLKRILEMLASNSTFKIIKTPLKKEGFGFIYNFEHKYRPKLAILTFVKL